MYVCTLCTHIIILSQLEIVLYSRYLFCRMCSISTTACRLRQTEGDRPVAYSQSKAQNWNPVDGFASPRRMTTMPKYQPAIVLASTAAFLIYFLVLREENDIDEEIGQSIYSRIPGLEEKSIQATIQHGKLAGQNTEALEKRLKDVQASKNV